MNCKKENLFVKLLSVFKVFDNDIYDYDYLVSYFVTKGLLSEDKQDKNILIPDTVSNWFSAFISRNGFKQVHFHSLRHANISILVAKGIDPKVIGKRAGHSSFDITLEIYAREEEEQDIIAAKKLDEALA